MSSQSECSAKLVFTFEKFSNIQQLDYIVNAIYTLYSKRCKTTEKTLYSAKRFQCKMVQFCFSEWYSIGLKKFPSDLHDIVAEAFNRFYLKT